MPRERSYKRKESPQRQQKRVEREEVETEEHVNDLLVRRRW